MLFHVSVDPRIPIGARGPGRDIMERLGVFHTVLPAQFPSPRQPELLDVIAIGSDVVIAQQRQALVALRQLSPQSRSQVPCRAFRRIRTVGVPEAESGISSE